MLLATSRRLGAAILMLLVTACASLPPEAVRVPSHAFEDTASTRIARNILPLTAAHPGQTGAQLLRNGPDAFAVRYAMALAADRSIDVQYYIWRDDTSGSLLARALWEAAERGVRVRVLLDDANTGGLDPQLAVLDTHARIEIRLFNPFANRSFRVADFIGDFSRVNRRMHNKSFTVDNQATVVGGRNIGDEYLGAEGVVAFADLDVLAIGPVVREVSADFDRYWNSEHAWPVENLLAPATPQLQQDIRETWDARHASPASLEYLERVSAAQLLPKIRDGTLPLEWVPARLLSDDPDKVRLPQEQQKAGVLQRIQEALGRPERELLLVSPYFVPGRTGTDALVAMAARGVSVAVLTNSLAATDVAPVYAGYVRYRKDLLRGGVRIFELKPGAVPRPPHGEPDDARRGVGGSTGGSSGASLHAKSFAVDRSRIFVGSFNLDPRSMWLNTEMGVVLESPAFARQLAELFAGPVLRDAFEVRLDGDEVVWIARDGDGESRQSRTPGAGVLRRMWIGFLALLPIEWLL